MNDRSDAQPSRCEKLIPACWLVAIPLIIILFWAVGLGLASWWFWKEGITQTSPIQQFLLVAGVFGALGGLTEAARGLWQNVYQIWEFRKTGCKTCIKGSPLNNFIVRPILWPIAGAVLGVAFAAVLLDEKASLLRVVVVGTVGGILWPTIQNTLAKQFINEKNAKKA